MKTLVVIPSRHRIIANAVESTTSPLTGAYKEPTMSGGGAMWVEYRKRGECALGFDIPDVEWGPDYIIEKIEISTLIQISTTFTGNASVSLYYDDALVRPSRTNLNGKQLITFELTPDEIDSLDDLAHFEFRYSADGIKPPSSANNSFFIYGASIAIDYYAGPPVTVTSNLVEDSEKYGSVEPLGVTNTHAGEEYSMTITPKNPYFIVNVTKNGDDISGELTEHTEHYEVTDNLRGYHLISGRFNTTAAEGYFRSIIGNGYDAPRTTTTTYKSATRNSRVIFAYDCHVIIPEKARIISAYAKAIGLGHQYLTLKNSATGASLSSKYDINTGSYSSDSRKIVTMEFTTPPTREDLATLEVECELTYNSGGRIDGLTVFVECEYGDTKYYTYSYTIDDNTDINVSIGYDDSTPRLLMKMDKKWVEVDKGYLKKNGEWIERNLIDIIEPDGVYFKGN